MSNVILYCLCLNVVVLVNSIRHVGWWLVSTCSSVNCLRHIVVTSNIILHAKHNAALPVLIVLYAYVPTKLHLNLLY